MDRIRQSPAWLVDAGAIALLALLTRLVYGAGAIGYDASFALAWGRELAHGQTPDFKGLLSPTPHPLANVVSAALSALGDRALVAVMAISFVSFAALAWFGFRFAARVFNPAGGALFALLVLTRPALINETLQALVDLPFLALVAGAASAVAARRSPRLVLVLLLLAGLLRPEGWPLALLYAAWCWRAADSRQRIELAALAVAAPLLWFAFDAAVTGDPLWSLHGTQTLATDLGRPRGTQSALVATPGYLRSLIQPVVAWLGLVGCLVALALLYEAAVGPAAIAGLGLAGFIVLGSAGLPVLTRYLFVPAVILVLFAAVAVFGWMRLPPGGGERRWWSYAAVAAALALIATIPSTVDSVRFNRAFLAERRAVYAQLHELVRSPAARRAVAGCTRVVAPQHRPVPLLAYWLTRKPSTIGQDPRGLRHGDAYFAIADPSVASAVSLTGGEPPAPAVRPVGFTQLAATGAWRLYADCG